MNYRIFSETEKAFSRTHKCNEDTLLFTEFSFMNDEEKIILMVVADGMGGLSNGEIASRNAVTGFTQSCYNEIMNCYLEHQDMDEWSLEYSIQDVENAMVQAVQAANKMVCDQADPLCETGTTLSAVCVLDGFAVILNVGDSPVYFFRKEKNNLKLISTLHTKAEQDVEEGLYERYSDEYYENDHRIYASLGAYQKLSPEDISLTSVGNLKAGDAFVIGSDGAFGRMMENEIQDLMSYCGNGNEGFFLTQLFSRAHEDKDDDQTAIFFVCKEEEKRNG